jgi:nucleoside-diphosphate-sugar epimerase
MKNILVTGGAGFIGQQLVNRLLLLYQRHYKLVIIDNLSNYNPIPIFIYDVEENSR